eukprot:767129_1
MSASIMISFFAFITICNSQWTLITDPLLHRSNYLMAVGAFNSSIWILGGAGGPIQNKQLIEYQIDQNTFTAHNASALSEAAYGRGQFYTQIDHSLFMIHPYGDSISHYNMATNTFTSGWSNVAIPINVASAACLTASTDSLYVVGGGSESSPINNIQILSLSTHEWLSDTLPMLTNRAFLSCIIHPSSPSLLFAIGGYDGSNHSNTIEQIDIDSNVSHYTESLTVTADRTRSVIYGESIWIIGGFGDRGYYDTVHILDPLLGKISLRSQALPIAIYGVAAITVNSAIFAFGGRTRNGVAVDTWMVYNYTLLRHFVDRHTLTICNTQYFDSPNPTTSVQTTPATFPTIDAVLRNIIIILGAIDGVLIIICIYYITTRLRHRIGEPGSATWSDAIKHFGSAEYAGVVLEIFDILTDYLFAADLIVSQEKDESLIVLGWISLMFAIL